MQCAGRSGGLESFTWSEMALNPGAQAPLLLTTLQQQLCDLWRQLGQLAGIEDLVNLALQWQRWGSAEDQYIGDRLKEEAIRGEVDLAMTEDCFLSTVVSQQGRLLAAEAR